MCVWVCVCNASGKYNKLINLLNRTYWTQYYFFIVVAVVEAVGEGLTDCLTEWMGLLAH